MTVSAKQWSMLHADYFLPTTAPLLPLSLNDAALSDVSELVTIVELTAAYTCPERPHYGTARVG